MKVLDLHCGNGHPFEAWFGSEDDFRSQSVRGLVECPMCGNPQITKMISAPRLNLSASRVAATSVGSGPAISAESPAGGSADADRLVRMRAAWWHAARQAVRNTEDVGPRFAAEARRIHQGDAEDRGIRGQASHEEVRQLVEEGVPILPLPAALKETLQ